MNLSGLSLRDLEYVVAIADHGNFVRAAAHCRVAQPSLSAQVRKLEGFLGIEIFERTTRRVMITAQGRPFIEQARRVLAEARILLTIATPKALFGGPLRLSAIATLGPYLFPLILGQLRRDYPDMAFILGEGKTDDLLVALQDGALDAALLSLPLALSALTVEPLFDEPFLLACPSGHPAATASGPNWDALDPDDRLLLDEGHCLRDQALAACAGVSSVNRHATSLSTLKYMVGAGEGCTLVPALAVTPVEGVTYWAQDLPALSRTIALVWRRSDARGEEIRHISRAIKTALATADVTIV